MNKYVGGSCAVVLLFLSLCAVSAHAARDEFKWVRLIETGGLIEDEIISVELDSHLYEGTRPDYADLRVIDEEAGHVPYILEKATSNEFLKVVQQVSSGVDGIEKPDANRLVFYLSVTATNQPLVHGLFIDTPLKDFERQVSVFVKNADGEWGALITNALLYDYTRFIDLRQTRIALPPGHYKSFRVEIDQVTEDKESTLVELERTFQHREEIQRTDRTSIEKRPFRINRISLWTEEQREIVKVDHKVDYPVVSFETTVDAGEKSTVVLIKTHGEPLTELSIEADGQNFNRNAEVQIPVYEGAQKSWRAIEAGVISQISFRGFKHTQATLTFAERRSKEYRIRVQNQDNPPLRVSGVSARGNLYHLLFLAEEGGEYALAYGNEAAVKPQYDAGAILGPLRQGYTPRSVLAGEPSLNKSYRGQSRLAFFNGPVFFIIAAGFFVIILSGALFRARKQLSEPPANK